VAGMGSATLQRARSRASSAGRALSLAPKLIPLIGHRYLPEEPRESGNPVFSIFYTDAIYYGANLEDYFEREYAWQSGSWPSWPRPSQIKYIPFWSDLVERSAQNRNRPA
jgi:hypothetical protein